MTTLSIIDPRTEKTIQVEDISREDYLARRTKWKADYAKLSRDIRDLKLQIKSAQRNLDSSEVAGLTVEREIMRDYANAALEERRLMKLQAQASYEAAREENRLAA